MNTRGLVFRLGKFAVYREIDAVDKVLYIAKPIVISKYKHVRILRCTIKRLPWFRGEYSVIQDIVDSEVKSCRITQ